MEPIHPHHGPVLSLSKGFTLVELMVVLAIVVVIMAIAFSSQGSFNKTLILSNAAYDIALTLRSAETYGLGSRALGATVNAGYGVHFQSTILNSFTLFADTSPAIPPSCTTPDCNPGNHVYTSGADTFVQTYTLGNGVTIGDFCAQSSGVWSCASEGALTSLDIIFERPNPDAFMSKNGSYVAPPLSVTAACITLTSPQGGERYVSVGAAGQIIANASSCP